MRKFFAGRYEGGEDVGKDAEQKGAPRLCCPGSRNLICQQSPVLNFSPYAL